IEARRPRPGRWPAGPVASDAAGTSPLRRAEAVEAVVAGAAVDGGGAGRPLAFAARTVAVLAMAAGGAVAHAVPTAAIRSAPGADGVAAAAVVLIRGHIGADAGAAGRSDAVARSGAVAAVVLIRGQIGAAVAAAGRSGAGAGSGAGAAVVRIREQIGADAGAAGRRGAGAGIGAGAAGIDAELGV